MPQTTTISDQIFAKCSAALSIDSSRCDGITSASIAATTTADLNNIYKDGTAWNIDGLLLEADFLGKSCFPRQYGMYDWLQSISKRVGPKRLSLAQVNSGLTELYPFVKMGRKGPINNEFWTFSGGAAGGTTPGGLTADWKGTVSSQTGIPADPRWFPTKMRINISGLSGGSSHSMTQYEVIETVQAGSVITIYLKSLNASSFFIANGQSAKVAAPTSGLLTRGTANVSDYESYCPQIPGLNTNQLSPFWIETTRWSYRMCEMMEKYLDAIRKNNALFRQFGDVESVELNRQIQQDFERRQAYAFFFNKPYPNQTLATYDQLLPIVIADGSVIHNPNGGKTVGRRAAAIGIYEQHAECGRVFDLQGQVLNLQEWFQALYQIQRTRQSNGQDGKIIEVFTDDAYAIQLEQGLFRYFAMKSEGLLRLNHDLCGKCNDGPFGFRWKSFKLDFPNVELRIVTHPFFNDMLQAHTQVGPTFTTPGRVLWVIDWSVNYEMDFDANSVMLTSGDLNRLAEVDFASYGCVMKLPRDKQRLMSKTYTYVAECPQSSMFLENMSAAIPEHRGFSGTPADYAGVYS